MMEKINYDVLNRMRSDKQVELNDEMHEVFCKTMIGLLQDSIAGPGISQQQIETAREFAELKPNSEAAKEALEFLDSEEVQQALMRST